VLKILEVLVEPKGLFSVASLLSLLLLVFVSVSLVERALKAGREPPTVDDEFATGNEKEDVAEASVVEGVIDVDWLKAFWADAAKFTLANGFLSGAGLAAVVDAVVLVWVWLTKRFLRVVEESSLMGPFSVEEIFGLISEPALTGVNVLVSVDGVRDTTLVREAFAASHLFCRSEKCDNPPFVGVVSAIIFFQRS
jgi:hypothetical protein